MDTIRELADEGVIWKERYDELTETYKVVILRQRGVERPPDAMEALSERGYIAACAEELGDLLVETWVEHA